MIRLVLLVVTLGGCDVLWNINQVAVGPDGMPLDATPISSDGRCMVGETQIGHNGTAGAGLLQVCVPANAGPVALTTSFDTGTSQMCHPALQDNGVPVCVIYGHDITIPLGATVQVVGDRPLVLAAEGTLTISGELDINGRMGAPGPGGDAPNCTAGAGDDNAAKGAAGGGGGSWNTLGGKGGKGGQTSLGGMPSTVTGIAYIRGGCQGGKGGTATASGGNGGHGGGAVYLVAGASVELHGTIDAAGSGGHFGPGNVTVAAAGGGGGGSGGLIAFDTPHLEIDPSVILFANGGGGGGGGASGTGATNGTDGSLSTSPIVPGAGGPGGIAMTATMDGGNGGTGALGVGVGGAGATQGINAGGGGGGGGQGFVVLYGPERALPNSASPPLSYF